MSFSFRDYGIINDDDIILARSRLWTPDLDKLLRKWKNQIGQRQRIHTQISQSLRKRHYLFGVPAAILAFFVGTGVLATFQNCETLAEYDDGNLVDFLDSSKCQTDEIVRLIAGIVGILSGGLGIYHTFMDYQGRSEEHKTAADDYESMFRQIDTMLLVPGPVRGDPISVLQTVRNQYDNIVRNSPTLPDKYNITLNFEVVETRQNGYASPSTDGNIPPSTEGNTYKGETSTEKINPTSDEVRLDVDTSPSVHTSSGVQNDAGGTSSDSGEDISKILEMENDHSTSDEEKEVCIGFDLDSAMNMNPATAAYAAAQLTAIREAQIQNSLRKALDFEMNRFNNHESSGRRRGSRRR